jgi:hypothetical protein
MPYDRVAAIGAVLVVTAMLLFATRISRGLLKALPESHRSLNR